MTFKLVRDSVTPSLNRINDRLSRVPKAALDYWKKNTPKRSGNARRKTKLVNNKTISANYDYAKRLDQGYSKKAPDGMSKPTLSFVKNLVSLILKRR